MSTPALIPKTLAIWRSPQMLRIDRILRCIAPKEVSVTLIGESGTGKEILAQRVHDLSARRAGPFIPINCAAIPEGLFESEMFGHERGAFTGANERAKAALRERRADIWPLIVHFTDLLSTRHGAAPPRYSRVARSALLGYDWPGNIRELRNTVESLCLLCPGRQVHLRDLPEPIRRAYGGDAGTGARDEITLRLDRPLDELVQEIIEATLIAERGSQVRAAARLGVSVRTIQRRLAGQQA